MNYERSTVRVHHNSSVWIKWHLHRYNFVNFVSFLLDVMMLFCPQNMFHSLPKTSCNGTRGVMKYLTAIQDFNRFTSWLPMNGHSPSDFFSVTVAVRSSKLVAKMWYNYGILTLHFSVGVNLKTSNTVKFNSQQFSR